MLNINLFGGPGLGKSTLALELTGRMKRAHILAECTQEYAKELVYRKENIRLRYQLGLFAEQNFRIQTLVGSVDYVINDSPLPLCLIYSGKDPHLNDVVFSQLVLDTFNTYDNVNILLKRNPDSKYSRSGRTQTISEAIVLDAMVKEMLDDNDIKYVTVTVDDKTLDNVYDIVTYVQSNKPSLEGYNHMYERFIRVE